MLSYFFVHGRFPPPPSYLFLSNISLSLSCNSLSDKYQTAAASLTRYLRDVTSAPTGSDSFDESERKRSAPSRGTVRNTRDLYVRQTEHCENRAARTCVRVDLRTSHTHVRTLNIHIGHYE